MLLFCAAHHFCAIASTVWLEKRQAGSQLNLAHCLRLLFSLIYSSQRQTGTVSA
jgi:hypothetical protein